MVSSSVLLPPTLKVKALENAPREAEDTEDSDLPKWVHEYTEQLMKGSDPKKQRDAGMMASAVSVSLIGAGRSHMQGTYVEMVERVSQACTSSLGCIILKSRMMILPLSPHLEKSMKTEALGGATFCKWDDARMVGASLKFLG